MTTDQLVLEVIDLKQAKARAEVEHKQFWNTINNIQEDVKATRELTEEVHIMASNITSMQKTLESTNKKVDELSTREFKEYQETKKDVKKKVILYIVELLLAAAAGGIGYALGHFVH